MVVCILVGCLFALVRPIRLPVQVCFSVVFCFLLLIVLTPRRLIVAIRKWSVSRFSFCRKFDPTLSRYQSLVSPSISHRGASIGTHALLILHSPPPPPPKAHPPISVTLLQRPPPRHPNPSPPPWFLFFIASRLLGNASVTAPAAAADRRLHSAPRDSGEASCPIRYR